MIDYLYNFLKLFAKPVYILIGFILVALFNLVFFPGFSSYFGVTSSLNDVLDLKLHYNPEVVYGIFDRLGDKGLKIYKASEIFVDFPYLIVYTILYAALITRLSDLLQLKNKAYLLYIPLLLGVFDILENIGIIKLIGAYPEKMNALVSITSVFTTLKWIFALLTLGTIIFLTAMWLLNRRKK